MYAYDEPEACEGSLWTGSQRYAWVDLTAGPVRTPFFLHPTRRPLTPERDAPFLFFLCSPQSHQTLIST